MLTFYESLSLCGYDTNEDPRFQKWRSLMLTYTPYHFPEPLSFNPLFFAHPAQINVPSPDTMIQFPMVQDGERINVIVTMDTATQGVGFMVWDPETDKDAMFEASVVAQGRYRLTDKGVVLSIHRPSPNDPPLTQDLVSLYESMTTRALYYINVMPARTIHYNFSRQQRRSTERSLGYPLKAMTEIVITQNPKPKVSIATGEGTKKCLHSVKGHVRTYHRGTSEQFSVWIPPHDRGDPALGLKRTKYKVESPAYCPPGPDVV